MQVACPAAPWNNRCQFSDTSDPCVIVCLLTLCGGLEICPCTTSCRAFAAQALCAAGSIAVVWPCLLVPAIALPDLTKLQSLCCLVRCSFDLFLNSYIPCNVTSSSAVFPMYLYPRMLQNSNSLIVSLLPDF